MIRTSLIAITFCALATGLPAREKKTQAIKHVICTAEESAQRIEAAIRKRIRKPKGELTTTDFERVTHLSLAGKGLTDITPLAKLTKIRSLILDYNEISDLTPLAGLVELEKLHLGSNQITDLSPLANLKKLKFVPLFRNQISDLGPIANWFQAEHLALYCNPVSDLRPLHGLANLRKVKLQGNPVSPEALEAARKTQPQCEFMWQATQHVFDSHSPFDRGPVERHLKLPESEIPRGNGLFPDAFNTKYPVDRESRN
ncbi:MAG: leucine-rich repeat domain-containing protein [Akkermansiaceae bacterium]|nr:leucine-rich repeat domain-containing protein [Akkermansiaceae bacterium]